MLNRSQQTLAGAIIATAAFHDACYIMQRPVTWTECVHNLPGVAAPPPSLVAMFESKLREFGDIAFAARLLEISDVGTPGGVRVAPTVEGRRVLDYIRGVRDDDRNLRHQSARPPEKPMKQPVWHHPKGEWPRVLTIEDVVAFFGAAQGGTEQPHIGRTMTELTKKMKEGGAFILPNTVGDVTVTTRGAYRRRDAEVRAVRVTEDNVDAISTLLSGWSVSALHESVSSKIGVLTNLFIGVEVTSAGQVQQWQVKAGWWVAIVPEELNEIDVLPEEQDVSDVQKLRIFADSEFRTTFIVEEPK